MYTVGYRLIMNVVGKEWADKISEDCKRRGKSRISIPLPDQREWKKHFYKKIGDDDIADQLIHAYGGKRLCVNKLSVVTQKRLLRNAIKILNKNGYTHNEIEAIINDNIKNLKIENIIDN